MNRMLQYIGMWIALLLVGTACDDDTIINPDISHNKSTVTEEAMEKTSFFNSAFSPGCDIVLMNIGKSDEPLSEEERTDEVYLELVEPTTQELTLKVELDELFGKNFDINYMNNYVRDFNKEHNYNVGTRGNVDQEDLLDLLSISNEGIITIPAGEKRSSKIKITFKYSITYADKGLLLPLLATNVATGDVYGKVHYIICQQNSSVRRPKDFQVFAYVNTEEMNPLIADQFTLEVSLVNIMGGKNELVFKDVPAVDVVNLRTAQLKFVQNRAMLVYTSDMAYVLKKSEIYIRPLQNSGLKVCLTLQGGGSGLGFANLTDEQIADFVSQLKVAINLYKLDGINLWDRGAGYGKEGMPPINDSSYSKLIKAIKDAMPDKLLTMMDTPETTLSLRQEHDGIAAGNYLDYAWGNFGEFINPYAVDAPVDPIIGMEEDKYAVITLPIMSQSKLTMEGFIELQNKMKDIAAGTIVCNKKIYVIDDLTYFDYGEEGTMNETMGSPAAIFYNSYLFDLFNDMYSVKANSSVTTMAYNAYRKDW